MLWTVDCQMFCSSWAKCDRLFTIYRNLTSSGLIKYTKAIYIYIVFLLRVGIFGPDYWFFP